jgi:hypothetical protein
VVVVVQVVQVLKERDHQLALHLYLMGEPVSLPALLERLSYEQVVVVEVHAGNGLAVELGLRGVVMETLTVQALQRQQILVLVEEGLEEMAHNPAALAALVFVSWKFRQNFIQESQQVHQLSQW